METQTMADGKTSDINKKEVKRLLTSLESINPKEISKEDGLMDFEKMRQHPKISEVVKQLNEMGVTREYLFDNFFIAGMTMGHLLEIGAN